MPIIVTGAAGFIGFHVAKRLLERGDEVTGIDSLTDYYDVRLKHDRLALLREWPTFSFHHLDLADRAAVSGLFCNRDVRRVVHMAAQAGVRYSLEHPYAYIDANLAGFANVLEACRNNQIEHLVFASSSSVYGANTRVPFSVHDHTDHPVSLYAATKKANELMAHAYSHLYELPVTGLRFFTIYGPWGRPDMAYFKFTRNILEGNAIDVYNHGKMSRDFTYIDDAVEGVMRILDHPPQPDSDWDGSCPDPATSQAAYRIYNIGNHSPVNINDFISVIESALGLRANKNYLPMQAGDVTKTYADVDDLIRDFGYSPSTPIQDGITDFVNWYRQYYGVN